MNTRISTNSQAAWLAREVATLCGNGSGSADRLQTALNDLRDFSGIAKLQNLTKDLYCAYIEHLRDEVNSGDLAADTAAGRISSLNVALDTIGKPDLRESASEHDIKRTTNSDDKSNRPADTAAYRVFLESKALQGNRVAISVRLGVDVMREFGLRFREASATKYDTKDPLLSVLRIDRQDMPKNGRSREVEIVSDSQRKALVAAKSFAKANGMRSLIPNDMTLEQFRREAYRLVIEFRAVSGREFHYHGERHEFAHKRYADLWKRKTGHDIQCRAVMGLNGRKNHAQWSEWVQRETGLSKYDVRNADQNIRLMVSEDLGHGRIDVTLTYLA